MTCLNFPCSFFLHSLTCDGDWMLKKKWLDKNFLVFPEGWGQLKERTKGSESPQWKVQKEMGFVMKWADVRGQERLDAEQPAPPQLGSRWATHRWGGGRSCSDTKQGVTDITQHCSHVSKTSLSSSTLPTFQRNHFAWVWRLKFPSNTLEKTPHGPMNYTTTPQRSQKTWSPGVRHQLQQHLTNSVKYWDK